MFDKPTGSSKETSKSEAEAAMREVPVSSAICGILETSHRYRGFTSHPMRRFEPVTVRLYRRGHRS